jgi:glycosyltransferase involved in cell wall biosynthesis
VRVVVYPHRLEIGGSQINAIELAGAVHALGHDVIVFGQSGPLAERATALGADFVPAPRPRGRPSPKVMRALRRLVSERAVDVVHGYEWTTALEAYWGPRAHEGVPAVATVMSMAVAPFIPLDMPLVVGTEQIADHERRGGRRDVTVIEPPVDVVQNAPDAVDTTAFRRTHGLDPDAFVVVCVSRLAAELKLEGLLAAVAVAGRLAASTPLQLVIAGGGPNHAQVAQAAERANAEAGRRAVVLTGELRDPRPAYASADVCLGMGGSALRAMSFGRPLVVQGERGFWEMLTPGSVDRFLWTGWYGAGEGAEHGPVRLEAILRELLAEPGRRAALGAYARRLVEDRFSLEAAARRQLAQYEQAIAAAPIRRRAWIRPGGSSASKLVAYRIQSRVDQVRGRLRADDFNAKAVVSLAPPAPGRTAEAPSGIAA